MKLFLYLSLITQCLAKKYVISFKHPDGLKLIKQHLFATPSSSMEELNIKDYQIVNLDLTDKQYEEIKNLEYVGNIEDDNIMQIQLPVEHSKHSLGPNESLEWNIDRIDKPLDNMYNPVYQGENSNIYILDTGVYADHNQLSPKVLQGYNSVDKSTNTFDAHGHGTHCAGIAASDLYGVATQSKIVPVKVLANNGVGTITTVIRGIEWAVKDIKERGVCSVLSMSLGGGKSEIMNEAINKAYEDGVIAVVAAGNENEDACLYSPSSAEKAVTVSSSDINDKKSVFSNYGECSNIFAPGSNILSTYIGGKDRIRILSGTSMSAPHVSGVVAMLFEKYGCDNNNDFIVQKLYEFAEMGVIAGVEKPNLFLGIPLDGGTPRPTPRPTKPRPTQPPSPSPTPGSLEKDISNGVIWGPHGIRYNVDITPFRYSKKYTFMVFLYNQKGGKMLVNFRRKKVVFWRNGRKLATKKTDLLGLRKDRTSSLNISIGDNRLILKSKNSVKFTNQFFQSPLTHIAIKLKKFKSNVVLF